MPNIIPLEEIKLRLPPFVKIYDETYRGSRYKSKFIDTEYNEEFEAIVHSCITLQHGCKSRSNKLRSNKLIGKYGKVSIEEVIERLPKHLDIDKSSYKSLREKARFYDKEYKIWFTAYVSNVLRTNKGYCKERKLIEFSRQVTLSADEIEKRIQEKYPDKEIKLIKETYKKSNDIATWEIDGVKIKTLYNHLYSGRHFKRNELGIWKSHVHVRDNYTCQKCDKFGSEAHHIIRAVHDPKQELNIHNGITLCSTCHIKYHAQFKNRESLINFCEFLDNSKTEVIKRRLSDPPKYPRMK